MTSNPRVFIIHASEDKERFVLRFAERLISRGINAWLDKWEMLPGDKLVTKIFEGGLKLSDAVVVVLSNASIKKPWVQKELDTAVVKTIEEQTRLIPIRLDQCEVPTCLKDTLYQEILDLDRYDSEFERIVNAIFGQFERPTLGEQPSYVRSDVLNIGELTRIDSTIFEHACQMAIKQNHADIISGEQIVGDLKDMGISEAQIMETQEILEGRYYINVQRVLGPPHVYDFSITNFGFDQFAQVGIPDYGRICADVARCLVREVLQHNGQASKHSVAGELKQPLFIVEHILTILASNNLIKYSTSMGGDIFMDVYWVSPELRRKLEGNK